MAISTVKFQDLPDDVLLEIFKMLPFEDLVHCTGVCKKCNSVLRNSGPWKGKEYRTKHLEDTDTAIQLVKVIPQMKKISVGSCTTFCVWLDNCSVYFNSPVDWETLSHLILTTKIDRVTIPKNLFTPDFPKLFQKGRKLHSLTVSPDVVAPCPSYRISCHLVRQEGARSEARPPDSVAEAQVERRPSDSGSATDDSLLELCRVCPVLEELSLHTFYGLSEAGLQNLKMCSNLRVLKLTQNCGIVDLSFLGQCPNLEHLDLSLCVELRQSAFRYLLLLGKLVVFTCRHSFVRGLPVESVAEELSRLRLVDLLNSFGVNESQVRHVKATAPHVTVLGGDRVHEPELIEDFPEY